MKLRIGEILVQKGLVASSDIQSALEEQSKTGKPLGEILVQRNLISEKDLLLSLGEQLQIDYIDLKKTKINSEAIEAVPVKLVTHYNIMPVEINDGGVLTIAVNDPFNPWPLDDIQVNLGYSSRIVLACRQDIRDAIRRHYGVGADTVERLLKLEEESLSGDETTLVDESTEILSENEEHGAQDVTVVRLVEQILQEAVRRNATDIHIERGRESLAVRYRVDGLLADAQLPEEIRYLAPAICSRIKIMSGMDIVEKRLPQDGRSNMKIDSNEFDLRVSILPSRHGEDIAIRLLPVKRLFRMEDQGMKPEHMEIFKKLIQAPHGILFVTGPTGSGKSTTLYTMLSQINSRNRKTITVEDPIEYEIPGITQIQANTAINFTFARILRNILRHDPDVIMIGEVRDAETAEIAIQTALTGHLVFSTLHTNDAATGVTRLIDMGIEPFLISSSVLAFVAQRLVRLICPKCKTEVEHDKFEYWKKRLEGKIKTPPQKLLVGKGCEACNFTGYLGRTALYEILIIDEEIRKRILNKATVEEIKNTAIHQGMSTLWDDGCEKVADGLTTYEEVIRVIG